MHKHGNGRKMMEQKSTGSTHVKLLIVGSGPAGYTAAVYAARAMLNPLLIQGMQPGGQLTITTEVENWPGETEIQGPDLMVKMEEHARAMGTDIVIDMVTSLDLQRRPFTATCDSGRVVTADAVILATGGFQGNPELLARYVTPYAAAMYLRANPWSTGDGLLAAKKEWAPEA